MDFLIHHVEALIFCVPKPLPVRDIQRCIVEMFQADIDEEAILKTIGQLDQKYKSDHFSFELAESGGGYQFLTKPAYQASISLLLRQQSKRKLSTSALETLSIIAYKQPITKVEIEQIRGVNCDYSIQKLLEKELVEIRGKSDKVGRPLLYGTSSKFMDYFGINSLKDLPTLKDFSKAENEIGDKQEE